MKAGANAAARRRSGPQTRPDVTLSDDGVVRYPHLGTEHRQQRVLSFAIKSGEGDPCCKRQALSALFLF